MPALSGARNFAFVYYARRRVDAEIAVVHLIDYSVGDVGELGAAVVAPAFGVGAVEVYDCGSDAVGACGFGPRRSSARRLRR